MGQAREDKRWTSFPSFFVPNLRPHRSACVPLALRSEPWMYAESLGVVRCAV